MMVRCIGPMQAGTVWRREQGLRDEASILPTCEFGLNCFHEREEMVADPGGSGWCDGVVSLLLLSTRGLRKPSAKRVGCLGCVWRQPHRRLRFLSRPRLPHAAQP